MKKVPIKELREDLKEELKEELVPDSAILDEKKMGEELYHIAGNSKGHKRFADCYCGFGFICGECKCFCKCGKSAAGRCDRNLLASAAYLQNIFAYQCAIFIIQYTS